MKIIYFDYCAVVLLAVTLVAMYVRHMTRGVVNRWVNLFLSVTFLSAVFDIWSVVLDTSGTGFVAQKYIANTLYLVVHSLCPLCFAGYVLAQTGSWYRLREKKALRIAFFVPYMCFTATMLVVNPFLKSVFYIDEQGLYTRALWFPVVYIIPVFYILIALLDLFIARKLFGVRKCIYMCSAVFAIVGATIIQFFFPQYLVEMYMSSLAALILVLGIHKAEERIHPDTGLYKRSAYANDLRMFADMGRSVYIVLINIINYSAIQEMLGYDGVHEAMREIANELRKMSHEKHLDLDLYYGGNGCFRIVIDNRYEEEAMELAHSVNALLLSDFEIWDMQLNLVANVCVANFPKDIDSVNYMLDFGSNLSDEAFTGEVRYAEKMFDKHTYEMHSNMSAIIERGFTDQTFELYYQPVYSDELNRYVSVETFLRLHDETYGDIPPTDIIAQAEKNGSVHAITAYELEEVCKFVSSPVFLELGLSYVEINLSPTQCMWEDLVAVLLSTLSSYGVPSHRICLNITDVESVDDYTSMIDNLKSLSTAGIILEMDDFGAGVFEIERMTTFPLSGIKLDRSFVKKAIEQNNKSLLSNTVNMIRELGMNVVAVGVEDENIRNFMEAIGCHIMQGYYYARPMPLIDCVALLLNAQIGIISSDQAEEVQL